MNLRSRINFNLFKYTDDMALVGRLSKAGTEGDTLYYSYINLFQNWCKPSSLEINVNKTKELVISRNKLDFIEGLEPLILDGHQRR